MDSQPGISHDPPSRNSPFFTVPEVAAYCRVKPCTIYKWVRRKIIPHIKRFGRLLFRKTVIDK
jgi:excisionase family DNA binding protein